MQFPSNLLQRTVNVNEDINVQLLYPSAPSPDSVFYAGALIYDYDTVATMVFSFMQFKFRIWEYFLNFT
jgi:hypothetical protein